MKAKRLSPLLDLQRRFPVLQILAAVVLFIVGASTIDGFSSKSSVMAILVGASFLGLAAVGQTIVILVGGIDFSIPAFIALGAIVMSELTGNHSWSFIPALLVILAIAAALGALSGFIAHRFRAHPLVVTVGMASILTGALLAWTHSDPSGTPPAFLGRLTSAGGSTFGVGIPPIVIIWIVITIIVGMALRRTVSGRWLYATGANPRAAELALVRTGRVWVGAFMASLRPSSESCSRGMPERERPTSATRTSSKA